MKQNKAYRSSPLLSTVATVPLGCFYLWLSCVAVNIPQLGYEYVDSILIIILGKMNKWMKKIVYGRYAALLLSQHRNVHPGLKFTTCTLYTFHISKFFDVSIIWKIDRTKIQYRITNCLQISANSVFKSLYLSSIFQK